MGADPKSQLKIYGDTLCSNAKKMILPKADDKNYMAGKYIYKDILTSDLCQTVYVPTDRCPETVIFTQTPPAFP